jgi:hypothetical protein
MMLVFIADSMAGLIHTNKVKNFREARWQLLHRVFGLRHQAP